MKLLNKRSREAIELAGQCVMICSTNARELFISTSLDLFTFVEQQPTLLMTLAAYLRIYEQIVDKDLLGRVILILSKTRLYSNGDTVFNDESIDLGRTQFVRPFFG
jgi:hypothetical protein